MNGFLYGGCMIKAMILCINVLCTVTVSASWLHDASEKITVRRWNSFKKSANHDRSLLKHAPQSVTKDDFSKKEYDASDENPLIQDLQQLIDMSEERSHRSGYEASDENNPSFAKKERSAHKREFCLTDYLDELVDKERFDILIVNGASGSFSEEELSEGGSSCEKSPKVAQSSNNSVLNALCPIQRPIKRNNQRNIEVSEHVARAASLLLEKPAAKTVQEHDSSFGCC